MEFSEDFFKFVKEHAHDDVAALRLKYAAKSGRFNFPLDLAFVQIEARKKAVRKLPDFLDHDRFIFPSLISSEQASNQAVAEFHASLLSPGTSILDLTAGLGIDDMTFAANGINVTACEIDEFKCIALRHNSQIMGVEDSVRVINTDSIDFLRNCWSHYDAVFADPARRDSAGARVHALSDCQPDILLALPDIFNVADRLIVKCSPLLDLTLIRQTVADLSHIYAVCFRGECKEVLIDIGKDAEFSGVSVVDLDFESILSTFDTPFSLASNREASVYACRKSPADYKWLYEPNSGVMKTGDWYMLQSKFPNLEKADVNSHIFFSDVRYPDFPGRTFLVADIIDKKSLKSLKGEKLNVVSRNHPLSAPMVYKKYSIVPGSDSFLYAFRYQGNPVMIKVTPG